MISSGECISRDRLRMNVLVASLFSGELSESVGKLVC